MAKTVPPQLKVVFDSPAYSGEVLFDKNVKGQKRAETFLRSLEKQHQTRNKQKNRTDKLSVQITTL